MAEQHLTKSELAIMEVMWEQEEALTASEIIKASGDKEWKNSSIHLMVNALLEKGFLEVAGFKKTTKNYARTFKPTMTKEKYFVRNITFFVHKGSKAAKAVQAEGYKYRYLNDNSKPQPVKGTTIKRTIRIQNLAKITWKKVKCDKYEIRYSQKKNMKNAKKVNCGKNKTSLVIKKLKKNRKYYVQIRTKSGKKYSAWSKVKTISKR